MIILTANGTLDVTDLAQESIDWAHAHGLIVAVAAEDEVLASHAPISLMPTPFPRSGFEQSIELQTLFNQLVHRASRDQAFLEPIVADVAEVDEFTKNLYDIYKIILKEGDASPCTLGLHRSDYLLHSVDGQARPLQVEINTIAASFASLSTLTSRLHRYTSQRFGLIDPKKIDTVLPINRSIEAIPRGLAAAHERTGLGPKAVIIMVVQPGERNAYDQRHAEYLLGSQYGITMRRYSLDQIASNGRMDPETRHLHVFDELVSVVYFRAGYTPNDYPTMAEWDARLLIERSSAVKSPNIPYHLVGMKKVQQIFAQPGVIERFMNAEDSAKIRSCFAGLYSMSGEDGRRSLLLAKENPDGFVLKPQREGGGNNVYGDDIVDLLEKLNETQRKAYILMERIRAPEALGYMLRRSNISPISIVSELGIYGVFVAQGDEVLINEDCGYLLRSKAATSNEGGVATGFSHLDSVMLI